LACHTNLVGSRNICAPCSSWGHAAFCSELRVRAIRNLGWGLAVRARRGYHRACIAVAAKNARVVWAMLNRQTRCDVEA
jgi:hypothetical protein